MNRTVKQLLIWVVVIGGALCLRTFVSKGMSGAKDTHVSYSEMLNKAQAGQVRDVLIEGNTVIGHYGNNDTFRTTMPNGDSEMYTIFRSHGVNITTRDQNSNHWMNMFVSIAPFVLLLGFPIVGLLLLLIIVRRSRAQQPKSI